MLFSMTDSPTPTRAEISDVAHTAVMLGTDCVMFSEEAAAGQYPLEAVTTMKDVIMYSEATRPVEVHYQPTSRSTPARSPFLKLSLSLAENIDAVAVVAETKSGATAQQISSYRPDVPVIAVTSDDRTAQQLALVYGVKSYVRPAHAEAAQRLTDWLLRHKILHKMTR